MKKIYSIFTLTVILTIFLCFPASAAQINGVIYDETDSLGSPTLTMQGEETLPQLSNTLGTELRVDVLTRINPESIYDTAAWIYSVYDYGYGENNNGVTLTIFMEKQEEYVYSMPIDNGWCIYANLNNDKDSSEKLAEAIENAVEPYMVERAWNGEDMTMSATALTQAVEAMADAASDYIANYQPNENIKNISVEENEITEQNSASMQYVLDISDLLSYKDWEELEQRAEEISKNHNCGIYFALVDDYTLYGDGDIYDVTTQFYNNNLLGMGDKRDGIIVLLSMYERDYAMFVFGKNAQYAFDDYGQLMLEESFLGYFGNNDWYSGISRYIDECDKFLTMAENGKPVRQNKLPMFAIAIAVSCFISAIICLVLKRNMKTVYQKTEANEYIASGGLYLTNQYDRYTHTTETRTKIQKSSSSSGSSSKSGGGGSGRSGKF